MAFVFVYGKRVKKLYFSKFYDYSLTKDKKNAQRLADSINESIAKGTFNPKYYLRQKSYSLQEYSYNWLKSMKNNVSSVPGTTIIIL
ncbi:MAG: hypothetical protein DRH24_05650 [Deltaproteobacteria bacterium]|nr:MAG: hypothetical protein DRH24_05650 [Deltaproteobacteria bacterium]